MFKERAIQIMRGEIKSRLPYWFWGNYLCLKIVKHGIWFWRKGDEVMYLYPWARKNHSGRKFISLLFSGNGDLGDAAYFSLKELDKQWEEYSNYGSKMINIEKLLNDNGLRIGRLLSGSKSEYRNRFPGHEVYFNANIFSDNGKEWYGDLDLTIDGPILQKVATEAECKLYVLRELDGRFEAERAPFGEIKGKAVKIYEYSN
jgi:hypothetical protein